MFRPRRILTLVGGAAVVAALGAGVVAGVVPADVPARVASYVQPPGMLHGTGIVLSRDALVTYPPLLERLTGSPRLAAVGPSPRAAPRQATAMGVPCRMVVAAEKVLPVRRQQAPEDERQDPAVAVVLDVRRRIEPRERPEVAV